MWKCTNCKTQVSTESDQICWFCGYGKDGSPPKTPNSFPATHGEVERTAVSIPGYPQAGVLLTRYKDAYLLTKVTVGLGSFIKGLGVVLGAFLLLGTAIVSSQAGNFTGVVVFFVGAATACFVGMLIYVLGVLASAQGQILKASLDGAVNSSPFLANEHKAKIMSLPLC
jgi:hypothetical protein